ncbi:MAG TPA: VOC family protein [Sphingobium sp.]|nr:VOC family protein [Sphingobium sp.]
MTTLADLAPSVQAFRPFLPAKDFQTSLRFYETLGFHSFRLGEALAELRLGPNAFLLQGDYVKEWAENCVMHVLVEDIDAWWRVISALELEKSFDVPPPHPPKAEDWGLTVFYLTDPTGILWHFAAETDEQPLRQP